MGFLRDCPCHGSDPCPSEHVPVAKIAEIKSDITLLMNLNGCIGEDDTVVETKDENWKMLKAILVKIENLTK